jgi:DNA-binding MarR family transcriptional regulator
MDESKSERIAHIADQFARTFRRVRKGAASELRPLGLTWGQARALRVLDRAGEPMRVGELAARLDIVPRSATAAVDLLEGAGLAARTADPTDRRSVRVGLTDAGRALLDRMAAARRASAEELLGRLDEAQLARLGELLDTLNGEQDGGLAG